MSNQNGRYTIEGTVTFDIGIDYGPGYRWWRGIATEPFKHENISEENKDSLVHSMDYGDFGADFSYKVIKL